MCRIHLEKSSNFRNTMAPWPVFTGPTSVRKKKPSSLQVACPQATCDTCNYHCDKELYSTDVTRLQLFTVGGDNFRESLETLVSYNVCTDGIQQDCLYIEQGHLMTPTTFMTYSMAIDPRKTVVVTWTPIKMYSMPQQGSQPSSLLVYCDKVTFTKKRGR